VNLESSVKASLHGNITKSGRLPMIGNMPEVSGNREIQVMDHSVSHVARVIHTFRTEDTCIDGLLSQTLGVIG
jgi:hypothetical protein